MNNDGEDMYVEVCYGRNMSDALEYTIGIWHWRHMRHHDQYCVYRPDYLKEYNYNGALRERIFVLRKVRRR